MKEKNYISVSLFILLILLLLIGGNYLIKNKNTFSFKKEENLKIEKDKDYVYFTNKEVQSYKMDVYYEDIHINIDSKDAKIIEEQLNKEMSIYRNKYTKLKDVSIDKSTILYEVDDDDIYEADFMKYNVFDNTLYLTIEVSTGHINVTSPDSTSTLKYYCFSKDEGNLLTKEQIMKIGKIKEEDITNTINKYKEKNIYATIDNYELYLDKYGNVYMNLLVKEDNITYNDTVKLS